MPPTPQPGESREAAAIRWLTSLLAALVEQSAEGMLVVSREALAADHGEESLVESQAKDGSVLLKFDSPRFMAIYPLRSDSWTKNDPSQTSTVSLPTPTHEPILSQISLFPQQSPNGPQTGSTAPKGSEEVTRLEETLRKQQLASRMMAKQWGQELRNERTRRQSLESLLETEGLLNPK